MPNPVPVHGFSPRGMIAWVFPLCLLAVAPHAVSAQAALTVYPRVESHPVFPLQNDFVFNEGEAGYLEIGLHLNGSDTSQGSIPNRYEMKYRIHDFPDGPMTHIDRGKRMFLSWKRKGKYVGNHISAIIPSFNPEEWSRDGSGVGLEFGLNRSIDFGLAKATGHIGAEMTDFTVDRDMVIYATDTSDRIIDTTYEYFVRSRGAWNLKAGFTLQSKSAFRKAFAYYSLNYSHMPSGADILGHGFPFHVLSNGIGIKYCYRRFASVSFAYRNLMVSSRWFPVVWRNGFDVKFSI